MTTTTYDSAESIAQMLREHIHHEFAYAQPTLVITNDLNLLEQRVIDSMSVFQLVSFIEGTFSIVWEPEELVLKNFETIDALTAFVLAKRKAHA